MTVALKEQDRLLQVEDLHVSFTTYNGRVDAVRGVSFEVYKGETVAIVGESGCGKSVTAQTIMRLLPSPPSEITRGKIWFAGKDLTTLDEKEMTKIRGNQIAMIFQDPMTSLNPTMSIGKQITEGLRVHQHLDKRSAQAKAVEMLKLVGIPSPHQRLKQYPHQFSGGMRQRVMIAIALACAPQVLIADEPTTALDVTIQAQIIDLLKELQKQFGMSIVLITHDLGVVAEIADRVIVMYAGKVVETGTSEEIFYQARHPYTLGLLSSVPSLVQTARDELIPIPGAPPNLLRPPEGCPFVPRCKHAMQVCKQMPEMTKLSHWQQVACWLQHPYASAKQEDAVRDEEGL